MVECFSLGSTCELALQWAALPFAGRETVEQRVHILVAGESPASERHSVQFGLIVDIGPV